jgi:hypothetical protein
MINRNMGEKPIGLNRYLREAEDAQMPFIMERHRARPDDSDDPELVALLAALRVMKPGTDPEAPAKLCALLLTFGLTAQAAAGLIDYRCGWNPPDEELERAHGEEMREALALYARALDSLRACDPDSLCAGWHDVDRSCAPPATAAPASASRPAWLDDRKPRTNKRG